MTQIAPFPIWFGNARDGTNWQAIFASGLRAIVYVAAEQQLPMAPREMVILRFPLLDGCDNPRELLDLAIQTTADLIRAQCPTLLCCSVGRSRSPAIASGALALASSKEPSEILAHIGQSHAVDISPGLWQDVVESITRIRGTHE